MSSTPLLPPRTAPVPGTAEGTALSRSTGTAALAVALAARADLWEPRVRFREDTRWTSLLEPAVLADVLDPGLHAELAGAQVWLLSWLPGQGTDLHDHGASSGAFAVADGILTERVVSGGPRRSVRETDTLLPAGRLRFFGPHYVHQVTNRSDEPAVSLHVYAPRLTVMNTYRVDGDDLVRTGTERAGVDW